MISHVYYVDMNDALSVTRKLATTFWLHELNQLQHAWTEFIANHT